MFGKGKFSWMAAFMAAFALVLMVPAPLSAGQGGRAGASSRLTRRGDSGRIEVRAAAVHPVGLSEGDTLYRYNEATGKFSAWTYTDGEWEASATVTKEGVTLEEASDAELPRGGAFWLVRNKPVDEDGAAVPYYLTGGGRPGGYEQAINGGSLETPGKTLCANPTAVDVMVNELVFTDASGNTVKPDKNDTLEIPNGSGVPTCSSATPRTPSGAITCDPAPRRSSRRRCRSGRDADSGTCVGLRPTSRSSGTVGSTNKKGVRTV